MGSPAILLHRPQGMESSGWSRLLYPLLSQRGVARIPWGTTLLPWISPTPHSMRIKKTVSIGDPRAPSWLFLEFLAGEPQTRSDVLRVPDRQHRTCVSRKSPAQNRNPVVLNLYGNMTRIRDQLKSFLFTSRGDTVNANRWGVATAWPVASTHVVAPNPNRGPHPSVMKNMREEALGTWLQQVP